MPAKKIRIHYLLLWLILGAVVGALGTTLYRTAPPWGLIIALLATASLTVAARSFLRWAGLISAVIGWAITVQFLALEGPAGDVLIAGDTLGYSWLLGGILALFVGLILPFSLFQSDDASKNDTPVAKE